MIEEDWVTHNMIEEDWVNSAWMLRLRYLSSAGGAPGSQAFRPGLESIPSVLWLSGF